MLSLLTLSCDPLMFLFVVLVVFALHHEDYQSAILVRRFSSDPAWSGRLHSISYCCQHIVQMTDTRT